jgi:hypothetical protein
LAAVAGAFHAHVVLPINLHHHTWSQLHVFGNGSDYVLPVPAHAARASAEFVRTQKQCDTKVQVVYHILLFCRGAEQRSSSRNIPNVFRVFFHFNQNLPGPLFARKSKQLSTSSRHHLSVYFFLGAACPIVSAASPATRTQTAGKLYLLGGALLSSLGLGGLLGSLGLGDLCG